MADLSDENRDLMLSLYLDGELDPDQAQAVKEKIRTDETWQSEYALLRSSETRVTRVVEDNWLDEAFVASVRDRLKSAPPPTTARPSPASLNRRWFWTLLALLGACGLLILFRPSQERPPAPPVVPRAQIVAGQAAIAGAPVEKGFELTDHHELSANRGRVLLRWADGSLLWLREGTVLSANSNGGPAIAKGQVLVQTSPGVALWVTDTGKTRRALRDGLFALDASSMGLCIRVFKGSATSADGRTMADAGVELDAADAARPIDPRLLYAWRADVQSTTEGSTLQWPPTWSQAGGAADHAGTTPLQGVSSLKQQRFIPIESNRSFDAVSPAVIDGEGNVYLAWQSASDVVSFGRMDIKGPETTTRVLANRPGRLIGSPVITASGHVLLATSEKHLRAMDQDSVAWEKDLGSSVAALTALPNGLIVCGTFQRLVALRDDGSEAWTYQGLADFQPPATLCRDGSLLVVSHSGKAAGLSVAGQELPGRNMDLSPHIGPFGTPVIQQDGSILLTDASGRLLQRAASAAPTFTLPDLRLTATPLGTGTCAAGREIVLANGARVEVPGNEAVIALAADGAGHLYAATQNAVLLYTAGGNNITPPALVESAPVKDGQIVPNGLAIAPGKLIVTTTGGVVVFAEQP